MNIDGMDFDDNLSMLDSNENLWRAVLINAVEEAVFGLVRCHNGRSDRVALIREAREYIITPNTDFDEVCSLAGLDPEAVRGRVTRQIADAPTPEELVVQGRQKRTHLPFASKDKPKVEKDAPRYEHGGLNLTLAEWSQRSAVPVSLLRKRLTLGWPISRAIEKIDGRLTRHRIAGKRPTLRPGVVFNFWPSKGTGAGSTAQESAEITFSKMDENA